ncbi:MAG: hypothetical protein JWP49_1007 [Phenylobacterium sp.]|nr:hypothetical protein [Phenylobacterium sp.]
MSSADEYRAKALLMRQQAAKQISPDLREDYERMAHGWEAMAKRADRRPVDLPEPGPQDD